MPLGAVIEVDTRGRTVNGLISRSPGVVVIADKVLGDCVSMPLGVMTDDDITKLANDGKLIVAEFAGKNVKQSCYELRAGRTYYDLNDEGKTVQVGSDAKDYILLKPNQAIVIKTLESLDVPTDVVGHILLKGKLFSLGILPVCTYADPGFQGNLGIVMHNASPNYLRIRPGDEIAKIEFERLHKPVEKGYRGQHGFGSGFWPIDRDMIVSREDVEAHPRSGSFVDETRRAFGSEIGAAVDLVYGYGRKLMMSVVAYVGFALVLIVVTQAAGQRLSAVTAIVFGILTNLATSVLLYFSTSIRRRRRRRRNDGDR